MATKQEQIDRLETESLTRVHIDVVRKLLHRVAFELIKRGEDHDATKLQDPEMEGFCEFLPQLKTLTYGSDEYNETLKKLQKTLEHHYARNKHHPEHYENGVEDMTLIDLIEMFCDWKAATQKHHDGNIRKSIGLNAKRFGIDAQLTKILHNTVAMMEEKAE